MPQCQFLFSAVFRFRKASQEIFSELDKNQRSPGFHRHEDEVRRAHEEATQGSQTPLGRGPPAWRAVVVCGALGWPHATPFRLYIASVPKTLNT